MAVSSRVRLGTPADEDDLVYAGKRMHEDAEWGLRYGNGDPLPFSERKARDTIRNALYPPDESAPILGRSFIGIVGTPGKIEGSVCLSISSPFWSDAFFLAENWCYVLPEFRRSENAKQLIDFSKSFAKTLQLPFVIGVFSHERTEAKCRLYSRALKQPAVGSIFLFHGDDATTAGA